MIATQFVQWEIQPLENLNGSRVYQLREKLNNGQVMNRAEKDWLAEMYGTTPISVPQFR